METFFGVNFKDLKPKAKRRLISDDSFGVVVAYKVGVVLVKVGVPVIKVVRIIKKYADTVRSEEGVRARLNRYRGVKI